MITPSNRINRRLQFLAIFVLCTLSGCTLRASAANTLQEEVDRAFSGIQGAAVVIRVADKQVLAAHNSPVLTRGLAPYSLAGINSDDNFPPVVH